MTPTLVVEWPIGYEAPSATVLALLVRAYINDEEEIARQVRQLLGWVRDAAARRSRALDAEGSNEAEIPRSTRAGATIEADTMHAALARRAPGLARPEKACVGS